MSFERWMQEVNELCLGEYLMSIYDLPDMPFRDAYDDGLTPQEFMNETIPDLDALGSLILS
ncbi:MAG TPA: hypothetical protein VMI31_10030 [Fimbriimonadaceae bacterium]|nr:hypothetical protein [Fimbriimonadaceae bacterium]